MDQLAQSFAQGIRAQAMKSYATTRIDRDKSPQDHLKYVTHTVQKPINQKQRSENEENKNIEINQVNRKIKDSSIMQHILDKERAKYQKNQEIKTSYDLDPPPFVSSGQPLLIGSKTPKQNLDQSFSALMPDRTDLPGYFRQVDNLVNPAGPMSGLISRDRNNYANDYGIRPSQLPYDADVDILAENKNRYQELSHWQSTLDKPDEDNLVLLKKLNHERLSELHSKVKQNSAENNELTMFKSGLQYNEDFINSSVVESKKKRSLSAKSKAKFGGDFEDYLKRKRNDSARKRGNFDFMVDFDRYECTSPDHKRVNKDHSLLFKENVYNIVI